MTDLQTAKENLAGHTLCLCKDGNCILGEQRGIAPMMRLIADGMDLRGYSAADTVVGKAVAFLFVKCGIRQVFAKTLSRGGQAVLAQYAVLCEYETLADKVINRAGTDMCPMEKAVWNTDNPEEAYRILKEKTAGESLDFMSR